MKKYLKLQAKKSMSLFLAVLMVLSCWVWMAPEEAKEADAANIDFKTGYTVVVKWTISTEAVTGGNIKYKTVSNSGWGTESGEVTTLNSMSNMTAVGSYSHTFTTTDFPTVINVTTEAGCNAKCRTQVDSITINDKTVYTNSSEGWNGGNHMEYYPDYNGTGGNLGTSGSTSKGTFNWPRPMIAGFIDDTATADDINVKLNKVGGTDVEKATTFDINSYELYDQYGVKATDYLKNNSKYCPINSETTYVSGTNGGEATANTDIWVKSGTDNTVVVSPNLQISDPKSSDGKAEYYLVRKYVMDDCFGGTPTSKVSAKINITYPPYTVNFNSDLSNAKITADKEYTGIYSFSGYNGATITYPSKTEAAGYTFYGYWTKDQPKSGNASYNSLEADFAKPCSTEDYNAYKASGTVEGDIVTDTDGNKWYDAGKALDPSTAKYIDVSDNYANFVENWHGWWLSDDLTLKFYDVDGAFLGEQAVKYGQTQSDITWPKLSYSTYTSGAFTFTVDPSIWVNTDGTEINKNSVTFTKDLILTPKLTRDSYTGSYVVSFINPDNGLSVAVGTEGGNYDYRANIKSRADEALGKIADTPSDVDDDLDYSYELLGWSSVKPTTGKNYHVLLEDADFDVNGTAIGLNSDWVVRDAQTYYAVYRRHIKTYVVNFKYKDATGADATRQLKVKYGATLVPPTDYVPYTYVTKGFGYTFDKWAYSTDNGNATLDYSETIPFTSENISIAGAALEGSADLEPIVINATYGTPVRTPYTVTFNYVDGEGEAVVKNVEVKNEEFILQDTVETLNPAEKWDHEDHLYTYANSWKITEGSATVGVGGAEKKVDDIITTAELISLTPTSNLTFKAVYANPVPFYTVTYIDGANTVTYRVLKETNVPAWTYKAKDENGVESDEEYVPKDYEGEGGTFVFQGWYDQKQTDTTATNGNKITTADKVTGNLVLYSQFKFIPDTFMIKFMSYDGKVQLGAGKYEKGQNIEALVTTATVAAQGRAADDTYTYLFLGWDKPVPTFCEGYDVTFTAQYKPIYRYYDVKWYNSKLVDGKWVADKAVDGEGAETYLLATTHHTYNSKLYTPAVDNLTCLETAPEGQNYVFAGWYYNDAEGNAHKYERGMIVTAEMEFYATYTLTAKVHTVTTVVRGEETKYSVADGEKANIPDPQAGYVDATKHDEFAGWFTDAACTVAFNAETVITADTKIYAAFTESDHDFTNKALKAAPTYYAAGVNEVWCSCDEAQTKKEESIDMLTDTKIPTGTIYLGDKSWSSEGDPANSTDNDPISIFVNANTDVIITSNDTGDVNALYNPSGIGKGVKVIRAFVFPADTVLTADNYGAAQELAIDVYEAPYEIGENGEKKYTDDLTNNANFAVKVGDLIVADLTEDGKVQYDDENNIKFKSLESGKSYIIYYYVTDKAGNQLNRKVRTAKFLYDNTAPIFTVEGSSNNATIPTYCGTATVTGIEKDVILTVNDEVVTATYAEGEETGTYEIKYAEGIDNVIITATDKAGNTYSKKIKVNDHSYLTTEQAASCGVAGYKKVECIICGDVKAEETYDALDHIWSGREVIPADCVNNGKVVVTCEICGEKITTEFEDGTPVIPALDHEFAKDAEGNIIYDTVTASTCKTNGLAEAYCTACNGEFEGGYITKELALDENNHEDVTVTEVAADCINNGYYTKACSCGKIIEHKDHETDPDIYAAKGHGETVWEVIKEANCYQAGTMVEKCTVCTAIITAETAYGYTENADGDFAYVTDEDGKKVVENDLYKYYLVPATGEHVLVIKDKENDVQKPAVGVEGFVKWSCSTEGCTYTKTVDYEALEGFDVTFKDESGESVIKSYDDLLSGSMIGKSEVTAPEKAATTTVKYTFTGWKGDDGNTYKLPLTVTKNLVLTPVYRETKILYTHQFKVPNTWVATNAATDGYEEFATLVGAIGDERVPAATPVFKLADEKADAELKKLFTFEFKGWKNAKGEIVTDFTVAGDATFYAYFEAVAVKYTVTYYNGTAFVWQTTVDGGASVAFGGTAPTKNFDDEYHYSFSGKWYTDATLKTEYKGEAITADTRLYAGFNKEAHKDYVVNNKVGTVVPDSDPEVKDGIVQKADCLLPELTEYICACGHTKVVETNAALDHDMGEAVYDEESGYNVSTCKRGCGHTVKTKVSVTIEFVNEGLTAQISTVKAGSEVKYDLEKYGTPEKKATAEKTFTFAGWEDADGNKYAADATFKADADAVYTAYYTETDRTYTVTYVNNANGKYVVLETYTGLKYNEAIPAFKGDTSKLEVPNYTTHQHSEFDKWNIAANATVAGDMTISPVFKSVDHTLGAPEITGATCTEKGGLKQKCTGCAYTYNDYDAAQPALGHLWDSGVVTLEPDYATQTDGIRTFKCLRGCGATKEEAISGKSRSIKVTVKDENGTAIEHATVRLLKDGEIVKVQTTDNNGVTIFTGLDNGNYSIFVVDTNTAYNDIVVNEDGSVKNGDVVAEPEKEEVDTSCKCTCHKNTFWGTIFRLFQKIIKFFAGKPTCCACPDGRI